MGKPEKKKKRSEIKSFDPKDAKLFYGLKVVQDYEAINDGSVQGISPDPNTSRAKGSGPAATPNVKKIDIKIL